MKRNMVETILGAVVLVIAGCFLVFFYETTDIKPTTGYQISAAFSKIDGLQNGSLVKISGVKVGQVVSFDLDEKNYRAIVRMNIKNDIKIPVDSAAVIASESLLGGKFLSIEPGSDENMMKPGDRLEFTQSTPGLEQLLGQAIFSMQKDNKKDSKDPSEAKAK